MIIIHGEITIKAQVPVQCC